MLKAGFSRVDITPPLGLPISGYNEKRIAEGILDPLEINAVAISDDKDTILILASDLIGIELNRAAELRDIISKRTNVPEDHIFIQAIHQHTSINIRHFANFFENPLDEYHDNAFLDILFRKFGDVAQMAVNDMKEATVSTATKKTAKDLSFVRRYILKDGSIMTNPSTKRPDEIERPCSESDNNVRLIRFKRKDAKDIALVNFSTHPDVIGGNSYTADWPGFVRRFVEHDIDDVHCILVNGFQGDTNQVDFMSGKIDCGYEHSRFMGRTIADTVVEIWDKTEETCAEGISGEIRYVYTKTSTAGADRYDWAEKYYQDYLDGKIPLVGTVADIAEARRILAMKDQPMYRKLPVTVVRFGKIAFVGLGGEPFTAYGEKARAADPDSFVVCACCTNGYQGYLPTYAAFMEGGYEARSSNFTPELEEELTTAITEMLNNK